MRTFMAIETPEELKDLFINIQKQLNKDAKINFVRDFHLTLKFLGEIDEQKLEKVQSSLKEVKFSSFKMETSSLGVFPTESHIRVVWVGLEPHKEIMELQQLIDEKLQNLFSKDKRFHPHITLGRVKFVRDKKAFIENLKSIKVEKKGFEVKGFKLKKSTLTPEGPVYEDIEAYEF